MENFHLKNRNTRRASSKYNTTETYQASKNHRFKKGVICCCRLEPTCINGDRTDYFWQNPEIERVKTEIAMKITAQQQGLLQLRRQKCRSVLGVL